MGRPFGQQEVAAAFGCDVPGYGVEGEAGGEGDAVAAGAGLCAGVLQDGGQAARTAVVAGDGGVHAVGGHGAVRSGALPYRTFNVASPIIARISEMIQKRMTICGSAQPRFSKWWWMGAIRKMRFLVRL